MHFFCLNDPPTLQCVRTHRPEPALVFAEKSHDHLELFRANAATRLLRRRSMRGTFLRAVGVFARGTITDVVVQRICRA
jgi:hypothetical protein